LGAFGYRHDPYSGDWAGELELPTGWELWYDNQQLCPPRDPGCNPLSYNRRPEYKQEVGTVRVHSGEKAVKLFTTYGTHTAGFYQQVSVPPGSWVRFSIWLWAWSSNRSIPDYSFYPGKYGASVGIDPQGGTDWRSADIQWSVPITQHDQWVQLTLETYSASGELSVWTRGAPLWPVHHNDSYWDDALLQVLADAPAATATPTPTATPYPTPGATPTGQAPGRCDLARPIWHDDLGGPLANWGIDAGEGSIDTNSGWLLVHSGQSVARSTGLARSEHAWPTSGNFRLSFRFAFPQVTGYGVAIGVGSEPQQGQRILAGEPMPWGMDNILQIQQHAVSGPEAFTIRLLDGEPVWSHTSPDTSWHTLRLELHGLTYHLWVDGESLGERVSHWRPNSLYLGSPLVLPDRGVWTDVALDDLTLESCSLRLVLPLIQRHALSEAATLAAPAVANTPMPLPPPRPR
jgi:hypothetical protein